MPAFPLQAAELDNITAYFMTLKTPAGEPALSGGNPAAGQQFFLGKGNCTACHMIHGSGGMLGPDLSNIGRDRTLPQIEQAILDPGAPANAAPRGGRGGRGAPPPYRAVTVRLRNGQT